MTDDASMSISQEPKVCETTQSGDKTPFKSEFKDAVVDLISIKFGLQPVLVHALLSSMNRWQLSRFLKNLKLS